MMTWKQHLLGKLAEEAAEIAQIALKAQQFGLDDVWEKVAPLTVRDRLCGELDDLHGILALLEEDARFFYTPDRDRIKAKGEKVRHYARLSVSLGQLESCGPLQAPADEFRDLVFKRTGLAHEELQCPREKSSMTPCAARDGATAVTEDGRCVGCMAKVSLLLADERAKAPAPEPPPRDPFGEQLPVSWVCPTPGCKESHTPAEHLVARMDLPCSSCHGPLLRDFLPVPF